MASTVSCAVLDVGGAVECGAEIVDDHRRTLACERERFASADAPSGTGDDGDLAVELAVEGAHSRATVVRI